MQNCNSCNCGKQTIPAAQIYPVNCEFVIPAQYPYVRPVTDSYTCSCCGTIEPALKDYPSSGIFKGNGFALNNANPYLIDTTNMSYGQALTFSENIYTKITKRDDPSCINLAARFDFTDSTLTNTVRFDFLKNYTARKYEELSGVLPIIKNGIKFRVHYVVYNIDGGIEYEGHTDSKVDVTHFHFTSIKDVFVQSAQGLIIDNIPAMTFQGRYTICITHVEAFVEVINTKEHLQDPSLNPYYTFTDNNRKIILHNTEISGQEADDVLLIGNCQIQQSFEYLANVTTRLRMTYIAFTTIPIATGDTSPIWFALNEPTEQSITQLRNEVSALEDEVAALRTKDESQDAKITQLEGQVELNRQNISDLVQRVTQLEQDKIDMDSRFEALVQRVEKLEAIPLALVSYVEGKEIIRSQITWKGYGNLYQAATTFNASGNFEADVAAGLLVPVAADSADISEISERLSEVEETASIADANATHANDMVNSLGEMVSDLSTTVTTVNTNLTELTSTVTEQGSTLASHEKRISDLEFQNKLDASKINLIRISDNYVTSYDTYAATETEMFNHQDETYRIFVGSKCDVSTIPQRTYESNKNLVEFNANGRVTTIESSAFYNATALTTFSFGDDTSNVSSDISIEGGVFYGTSALKTIEFTPLADGYHYIIKNGGNFNKTGLEEVTITEAVTFGTPNQPDFTYSESLKTITFISSGNAIPSAEFASSPNVETINVASNIETIGNYAFDGPSNVTINIHRPENSITGAPWGATNPTINWLGE